VSDTALRRGVVLHFRGWNGGRHVGSENVDYLESRSGNRLGDVRTPWVAPGCDARYWGAERPRGDRVLLSPRGEVGGVYD